MSGQPEPTGVFSTIVGIVLGNTTDPDAIRRNVTVLYALAEYMEVR